MFALERGLFIIVGRAAVHAVGSAQNKGDFNKSSWDKNRKTSAEGIDCANWRGVPIGGRKRYRKRTLPSKEEEGIDEKVGVVDDEQAGKRLEWSFRK